MPTTTAAPAEERGNPLSGIQAETAGDDGLRGPVSSSDEPIAEFSSLETRKRCARMELHPEVPEGELSLEGVVLDKSCVIRSPMLPYVRMVVSLIEGRSVSRKELLQRLLKTMRQHSIRRRTRTEYVLHFLNQRPPQEKLHE
jgi:hypothetical protein